MTKMVNYTSGYAYQMIKEVSKIKNKRMHKRLSSVIVVSLTFILFFANCTSAFATDEAEQTVGDAGTVYDGSNPASISITPRSDAGFYITKALVSTTYKKMVFAKYMTSNWKQTASYTIADKNDVIFSFTFGYEGTGLSISVGTGANISSPIDADKTRWSKLAVYVDFTIKKYHIKRYTTGGVFINAYDSYQTITTDTYLRPKYQQ